jgi:hypothetical protein
MFPATTLPGTGDSITILIGVGVLVGKGIKVGGSDTDVAGSDNGLLVGGATCVIGNVVGKPLADVMGVRVGAEVFVGISVSAICSGELLRLHALNIMDKINNRKYP